MAFKETGEVGFDDDGFATHKSCGEKLVEYCNITRSGDYHLKRDGTTVLVGEEGDDKDYDGVWCEKCIVQVLLEEDEETGVVEG